MSAWNKTRFASWLKRAAAIIAIAAAATGGWAGYLRITGNFHTVESGAVYRSGQLSGPQFASRIQQNGIRTILNLRGNNAGAPWYDDELNASSRAGVQHIDFAISAGQELTDDEVRKISTILRDAPRPLLIHCEAGADRSGLVAALYELLVEQRPPAEARAQLSFRYGHFPWLGSRTVAMDNTFDRVVSQQQLPLPPRGQARLVP